MTILAGIEWHASDIIALISIILESIIIPLLAAIIRHYKKVKSDLTIEKKGTQALLRNNLLHLGLEYIDDGQISYVDKLNYENMYNAYHNLGSNGAMTDIYDKVMDLPVVNNEN